MTTSSAAGDTPRPAEAETDALIRATLTETARLHESMQTLSEAIALAARMCGLALAAGRTVLVFGNGGSAAEAQHFAAELSGRFMRDRRALSAIALTTDSSAMTAIANDYGFARMFGRQVEALGRAGDVAVGISTQRAFAERHRRAQDGARARVGDAGPDRTGCP